MAKNNKNNSGRAIEAYEIDDQNAFYPIREFNELGDITNAIDVGTHPNTIYRDGFAPASDTPQDIMFRRKSPGTGAFISDSEKNDSPTVWSSDGARFFGRLLAGIAKSSYCDRCKKLKLFSKLKSEVFTDPNSGDARVISVCKNNCRAYGPGRRGV